MIKTNVFPEFAQCTYLEENDEERLTFNDLCYKIKEFLNSSKSSTSAYGNQYLKSKLLSHYGVAVFVTEGKGLHDIVTFWEKNRKILLNYFKMPNNDNKDIQKKAMIETAARLIKSDIKTMVMPILNEYPKASDIQIDSALKYVSQSLQHFLQQLLVGKDKHQKEASIGHSII